MRSLVFHNHENQITRILSAIVYISIGVLGIIKFCCEVFRVYFGVFIRFLMVLIPLNQNIFRVSDGLLDLKVQSLLICSVVQQGHQMTRKLRTPYSYAAK